jgi:hypothetical protein
VELYIETGSITVAKYSFRWAFPCRTVLCQSTTLSFARKSYEWGNVQPTIHVWQHMLRMSETTGPTKPIRHLTAQRGISPRSLRHIPHRDLHLWPYRIQNVQQLNNADAVCQWLLQNCDVDEMPSTMSSWPMTSGMTDRFKANFTSFSMNPSSGLYVKQNQSYIKICNHQQVKFYFFYFEMAIIPKILQIHI